jgi:hypothetical protein
MELSPSLKSHQLLKNSQKFMESEGLLLCSQESTTDSYHDPDHSNPYHFIFF